MSFRAELFRQRGRNCERCGLRGRVEVHHKVPVSEGGDVYSFSNCLVLCRGCHVQEHNPLDADRAEWFRELCIADPRMVARAQSLPLRKG